MLTNNEKESLDFYESRERYLTHKLLSTSPNIKEIHFTKPEQRKFYDGWYIKNDGTTIYFEVKVRDFNKEKYKDWIMEVQKLNNLISLTSHSNVVYINIFTTHLEDVYSAIIFSINGRLSNWRKNGLPIQNKWMNQTTFKSRNKKCTKEVIMLEYEPGIDYMVESFSVKEVKKMEKTKSLF